MNNYFYIKVPWKPVTFVVAFSADLLNHKWDAWLGQAGNNFWPEKDCEQFLPSLVDLALCKLQVIKLCSAHILTYRFSFCKPESKCDMVSKTKREDKRRQGDYVFHDRECKVASVLYHHLISKNILVLLTRYHHLISRNILLLVTRYHHLISRNILVLVTK